MRWHSVLDVRKHDLLHLLSVVIGILTGTFKPQKKGGFLVMTISDLSVANTELEARRQTLDLISEFQQKCEDKGGWTGGWSVKLFLATLLCTTATTVSAGIASSGWKWLTVMLGGLSTVAVGIRDYFRFSNRHAFYRRAIVECERLNFACVEATTYKELKSVQDRFFVLKQSEAESAVRIDATQADRKRQGAAQK